MSLMGLIAISGIFGSKNEDLDILPPPPPFPDIGIGKKPKDAAEEEWKQMKQKREEGRKTKIEFERQKSIEKEKGEGQRKKQEEIRKKLLEKQKKSDAKKEKIKIPKPMKEKIEPIKDISEIKLPEMEIEESVKPVDLEKAQEEIRKSIESMQREKRGPSIGRLFRKKEKEKVMEKIEIPEVMPRTFDKIDHVQEIEERIHKARMCLMDFKFGDAKKAYMEIMSLYNSLSQKDRYKVYQDIKDLYYERKSAEKFAKV